MKPDAEMTTDERDSAERELVQLNAAGMAYALERQAPYSEKANSYLNANGTIYKYAGFPVLKGVLAELEERDAQLAAVTKERDEAWAKQEATVEEWKKEIERRERAQAQLLASQAEVKALREALESAEVLLSAEFTFRRHSPTWKMLNGIERHEAIKAALSTSAPAVVWREELDKVSAELTEIKDAIYRSGMGIMRTSQGPSGTMIGYTAENEKKHSAKTLELIHENIDLGIAAKKLREDAERVLKPLEVCASIRPALRQELIERALQALATFRAKHPTV